MRIHVYIRHGQVIFDLRPPEMMPNSYEYKGWTEFALRDADGNEIPREEGQ